MWLGAVLFFRHEPVHFSLAVGMNQYEYYALAVAYAWGDDDYNAGCAFYLDGGRTKIHGVKVSTLFDQGYEEARDRFSVSEL